MPLATSKQITDRALIDASEGHRPYSRGAFWLVIALIALIGVQKAIYSPLDPDLFWHLRVARQLSEEGIHPIVDHISFASRKQPWAPYSWLAELGMRAIWRTFGYHGTILLLALTIAAIIFLIALSCLELARPRRGMNCVLATALAAYLVLPYLSFRPVTFAIFWLAIAAWLLLRDRRLEQRSRAIWWLAPITVLLANMHLVVIFVPLWVGCLLAGAIWELRRDSENRPEHKRRAKRYAVLLVLLAACSLATPMLPGAIHSAWDYEFHDVLVNSRFIAEMRPIYAGWVGAITIAILAGLLAWAIVHRGSVRAGEWIWLLAGTAMMLRLGRFTPMFAMIAAPLLAATIPPMSDAVLTRRLVRNALAVLVALGIIRAVASFPPPSESLDKFLMKDDVIAYPAAAAQYVSEHVRPVHHRLINEFTWGGYLGWRLGDEYQILLDGRTQVYPPEFWRQMYLDGDQARLRLLRSITADAAIIPVRKSAFAESLEKLGWRCVYQDAHARVLLPPAATMPGH